MGVQRNPSGPLITATLVQINEALFWGKTKPPSIDPRDDDEIYIVKNYDRLDVIASDRLGDVQLGWVILERNNLRLSPNDLVPGRELFIPTRESLRTRGIIR